MMGLQESRYVRPLPPPPPTIPPRVEEDEGYCEEEEGAVACECYADARKRWKAQRALEKAREQLKGVVIMDFGICLLSCYMLSEYGREMFQESTLLLLWGRVAGEFLMMLVLANAVNQTTAPNSALNLCEFYGSVHLAFILAEVAFGVNSREKGMSFLPSHSSMANRFVVCRLILRIFSLCSLCLFVKKIENVQNIPPPLEHSNTGRRNASNNGLVVVETTVTERLTFPAGRKSYLERRRQRQLWRRRIVSPPPPPNSIVPSLQSSTYHSIIM